MSAHRSRRRLVAIVCSCAVVLAACGGGDPELSESERTPDVPPTVPTPPPTAEPTATPTADAGGADAGAEDSPADGGSDDDGSDDADGSPDGGGGSGGGAAIPTPTQGAISGEPAFTAASKLTTVGLDEIFFGDPVDFAAEVASTTWTGLPAEGSRPQCYTVQPATGPAGIFFTVLDGFIERVDITNPVITTRSGAGVGSTEADIVELFGDQLEVTDIEGGREIMFVPTDAVDRQFRIIWRTDGGVVESMRAGRVPGVLTSAPCA